MVFDPLLEDYNEVLSNIILNFALENKKYRHDNRKKTRAKRTIGGRKL
jgi:hypothetical protein